MYKTQLFCDNASEKKVAIFCYIANTRLLKHPDKVGIELQQMLNWKQVFSFSFPFSD